MDSNNDHDQRLALDESQLTMHAADIIAGAEPYRLRLSIVGAAPILLHRWDDDSVAEKAASAKGSRAKKTDNLESYVYRDKDGYLGVPGINLCGSLQLAAKFMADPRSPRKSALDLVKAGVIPLTDVAAFEPAARRWEFEDRRRVRVQMAAVTRVRPAMREGWRLQFDLLVTAPEYLPLATMAGLISNAGRLIGLCDYRPIFGRYNVTHLEQLTDEGASA